MLRLGTIFCLLAICASSFAQAKRVLGRLGQTIEKTKIYRAPSTRAGIYYQPKAFEYIVVKPWSNARYAKILMSNGADGFVLRKSIAELPYEVTAKNPVSRGTGSPASRSQVASYATNYIGTPYVWGGNDVRQGIDCSAFVKDMMGRIGVSLPRTASEQALVGQKITRLEDLISGDRLYFWEKKRNKIGHTGIYMGNGWFVHSSRGRGGVATDYLSPKWRKTLVAARR